MSHYFNFELGKRVNLITICLLWCRSHRLHIITLMMANICANPHQHIDISNCSLCFILYNKSVQGLLFVNQAINLLSITTLQGIVSLQVNNQTKLKLYTIYDFDFQSSLWMPRWDSTTMPTSDRKTCLLWGTGHKRMRKKLRPPNTILTTLLLMVSMFYCEVFTLWSYIITLKLWSNYFI